MLDPNNQHSTPTIVPSFELIMPYSNSVKQLDPGWKIHTVDKISFNLPLSLTADEVWLTTSNEKRNKMSTALTPTEKQKRFSGDPTMAVNVN